MDKERDKFLTEHLGECWHVSSGMVWICGNCKTDIGWRENNRNSVDVESLNPDFSTWEGFGKLLKLAKDKGGLDTVLATMASPDVILGDIDLIPDICATELYKFLKEKEGR